MATKKKRSKSRTKVLTTGSSFVSAFAGSFFNMVATFTTTGTVLLCLIVTKHFT